MNITHTAAVRRGALALSSIALTAAIGFGAMPHASADLYDDGDGTEMITSDPGYDDPGYDTGYDTSADMGDWDQGDMATPDISDPGDWDQDWSQDDTADIDAPPADEYAPPADEEPAGAPYTYQIADAPMQSDQDQDSDTLEPMDGFDLNDATTAQGDDAAQVLDATPVEVTAQEATAEEISQLSTSLQSEISSSSSMTSTSWTSGVTQWDSSWISYDSYYRPIIANPYLTPLSVYYTYDNATRVVQIPPLQRAVLSAPAAGVYNFTAVNQGASGKPAISTGSFSGGGYVPAPGQPAPAKPSPTNTLKNVLVDVHYSNGVSQPFRVRTLTDLGDDPSVGGHRVLLDEETPAWGTWTKAANGEKMFEITKTQQLPGLTTPSEAPLPGYDVQLANNTAAHAETNPLVYVAMGCGVLGLGAVGIFVASRRPRSTR